MKNRVKIMDSLHGKPHLRLVETNAYRIPERIQEHDPNLFVVFNTKRQRFEIHTLANKDGQTFGFMYPHDVLDARALFLVRKYNFHLRGRKLINEIEEQQERFERQIERQRRNELHGIAEEMYPYFRKIAWEV